MMTDARARAAALLRRLSDRLDPPRPRRRETFAADAAPDLGKVLELAASTDPVSVVRTDGVVTAIRGVPDDAWLPALSDAEVAHILSDMRERAHLARAVGALGG